MKTFEQQLTQYAAYHRDPRNIASHFLGVPMIMFAVVVLLSRPLLLNAAGIPVTAALLVALVTGAYYLRLHAGTGVLMALILAAMLWFGQHIAALETGAWLGWGTGLFVVGWIIQAIGHVYEGRKPRSLSACSGRMACRGRNCLERSEPEAAGPCGQARTRSIALNHRSRPRPPVRRPP